MANQVLKEIEVECDGVEQAVLEVQPTLPASTPGVLTVTPARLICKAGKQRCELTLKLSECKGGKDFAAELVFTLREPAGKGVELRGAPIAVEFSWEEPPKRVAILTESFDFGMLGPAANVAEREVEVHCVNVARAMLGVQLRAPNIPGHVSVTPASLTCKTGKAGHTLRLRVSECKPGVKYSGTAAFTLMEPKDRDVQFPRTEVPFSFSFAAPPQPKVPKVVANPTTVDFGTVTLQQHARVVRFRLSSPAENRVQLQARMSDLASIETRRAIRAQDVSLSRATVEVGGRAEAEIELRLTLRENVLDGMYQGQLTLEWNGRPALAVPAVVKVQRVPQK